MTTLPPAGAPSAPAQSHLSSLPVAFFYAGVTISISLTNKALLSNYSFDGYFLMLFVQLTLCVCAGRLSRSLLGNPLGLPARVDGALALRAAPMALAYVLNIAVGLCGLQLVSLPMYSALRRLVPIVMLAYEWGVLGQVASPRVRAAVAIIVAGTLMASWETLVSDAVGYGVALANNLLTAVYGHQQKRFKEAGVGHAARTAGAEGGGVALAVAEFFYGSSPSRGGGEEGGFSSRAAAAAGAGAGGGGGNGIALTAPPTIDTTAAAGAAATTKGGVFVEEGPRRSPLSSSPQPSSPPPLQPADAPLPPPPPPPPGKLSVAAIVFVNASVALPMSAIAVILRGEVPQLLASPDLASAGFWACFLGGALLGLVLSYAIALSNIVNSPLATSITGTGKDVFLSSLGWLLFPGFRATRLSVCGICLSFIGTFIFSSAKMFDGGPPAAAAGGAKGSDVGESTVVAIVEAPPPMIAAGGEGARDRRGGLGNARLAVDASSFATHGSSSASNDGMGGNDDFPEAPDKKSDGGGGKDAVTAAAASPSCSILASFGSSNNLSASGGAAAAVSAADKK